VKRLLPLLPLVAILAACGPEPESTPTACLTGPEDYLNALRVAPDQAQLAGSVPLSDCLVSDQSAGELNTVGQAVIAAATELNAEARRRPTSAATTRLGYLVGSVEEGASDTAGIHTDLVRRINAAARFSDDPKGLPASFERTFGAGYAAARDDG
jgi:hypothetical protein